MLTQIDIAIRKFTFIDFLQAILICAAGFWLYAVILFLGVKLTNGVISALIVGTLPLTITLCSKPQFNYKLLFGLALILVGIVVLLVVPLLHETLGSSLQNVHLSGIVLLFCALIMWTWYAIINPRFILKHTQMTSLDYTSLMGIISLVFMLPIFLLEFSPHSNLPSGK